MPAAIPAVAGEAILASEVMAAEAAAAAAAEAAAVEAASVAAAEAAATAAAEQAAAAAATEAGTTAATQAATTGAADAATQEAVRQQLAANAGQAGLPSIAPPAAPPAGIETLVQAPPTTPVVEASSTMLDYGMSRPVDMGGASGMTAPVDTTAPSEFGLSNQYGNYNMAGSVPSPAAAQTAAGQPGFFDQALDYIKNNKLSSASMGLQALNAFGKKKGPPEKEKYSGSLSKFSFNPDVYEPYEPQPPTPYQPRMYYAGGGTVEQMSNANAIGTNTGYPMADISKGAYATPYQQPISRNVLTGVTDTGVNPMTGEMSFAGGGIANLGGYSDGGRMLKGPGDGMSDNIPATIAGKQPARLANEEFVIPADVVSHLGNGSSDAGAKALYKMMDRVRQARTGKKAQGKQINPEKYLA